MLWLHYLHFLFLSTASLSFTNIIHGEVASASLQEITVKSYDDTYYNNAIGKTGLELKKELHNIIDDHTRLSYSAVWEALRDTDEDPNNKKQCDTLIYWAFARETYEWFRS